VASSVWKGYLTFGLISIPINLFSAARTERISFNQLHAECHTRLRQPLFCPTCNRMVERSEIIKGYEYEKDQYLLFSEEELSKVAPASARAMEILQFVKKEEVDPLYFDTSYYAVPEDAGRKAYQLLVGAMEESGCAAVAKLTMHQREYTVIIRPRSNGLTLHTMFYTNEVRQVAEYGQPADAGIKEGEKKLALQLIENLVAPFEPQNFSDEYQQRLKVLVEAKLAGREMVAATQPQLTPVIDLMEALKKSLAQREQTMKKPPATVIPVTTRRKAGKKAVGG
jgi:DNA end-binding protein Ku